MRVIVHPSAEGMERLRSLNKALMITEGDFGGPVLRVLDAVHRRQVNSAFVTEGGSTLRGRWAALNPSYAKRKRKAFPGKKILTLSGETRRRFTMATHPAHVARHVGGGRFWFGAASNVAAAHLYGQPALAAQRFGPTKARSIFGGVAPRLPIRDMISKTAAQIAEFPAALKEWYVTKRIPQVLRHFSKSFVFASRISDRALIVMRRGG